MKYAYLVVEGPHDVEFVARLLKPGFDRVREFEGLDPVWEPLVPTKFPHRGDLLARVPVPTFLQSATHSVALHSAQGIDNIARTLEESWIVLSRGVPIDSVGVVLDADKGELPQARQAELCRALATPHLTTLSWPNHPATLTAGPPRSGIFIMPDHHSAGTLEDLLLEASEQTYPGLHTHAVDYVQNVIRKSDALGLQTRDLKDLRKPAGERKATAACVANLLRPGKSIAVAIQDCRWLEPATLQQSPRLLAVQEFLHQLLELPVTPPRSAASAPAPRS